MRRVNLIVVFVSALMMCVAAWAGDIPLVASSLVPAASGKVSFEHDRNGNVKFTISTKHLAAPERLTPAKNSYVVWLKSSDGQQQNAGVLKINNDLEGSFSTTTPLKAFDIVITAEDSPTVSQPMGPEVMHAGVQVR
jgi:hypothetical protein